MSVAAAMDTTDADSLPSATGDLRPDPTPFACRRLGCPHRRKPSLRGDPRHRYCCNACCHGEFLAGRIAHTPNCTGHEPLSLQLHVRPVQWGVWQGAPLARKLRWYSDGLGVTATALSEAGWDVLDAILPRVRRDRELDIVAVPQNWAESEDHCFDVTAYRVEARLPAYRLREVTGMDACVQAQVAGSPDAAYLILRIVLDVEFRNLRRCLVRCQGGTHRSPAVACLLCSLVYNRARVGLVTPRTRSAAQEAGWAAVLP